MSRKILHPAYSLECGSLSVSSDESDDLLSLRVSREMDGRAGCLNCTVRTGNGGFNLSKGDDVSASLGYKGDLSSAFKGSLDAFTVGLYSAKILALDSIAKLQRARTNKVYEQQTCGSIVSDLAGEASVDTDSIDDGVTLPYYVAHDSKSLLDIILELAARNGFDVYATEENALCFKKYESSSATTFEYGKDIIRIEKLDQAPIFESVEVFGESPSGSSGAETAHWLTKEAVQGQSGSGYQISIQDRVVRDTDTASAVAEGLLAKMNLTKMVLLDVVGNASVKLNDTVEIASAPDPILNSEYQVRGIEQFLSKSAGYVTRFRLGARSEG